MEKTREEMLAIIRKVIGNKRFIFPDDYTRKVDYPNVGNEGKICAITKKNVFFTTKVLINYYYDEETDTYTAKIGKLPIYNRYNGFIRSNLKLEDLSLPDLTSLYKGLTYCLWWENDVMLPEIRTKLKKCEERVKMYEKLSKLI